MSNPLFNQFNGGIIKQFNDFANNFKGNPQEQVMNLLKSGKMSQQQFNQLQQQANQFMEILKQFN